MRTLVLVDGEHYPPVTRWAIEHARDQGYEVVAALLAGGSEKLSMEPLELGVPLRRSDGQLTEALAAALEELEPEIVLDLSDEPVLGYRERMAAAAVTLAAGVPYVGADFRLDPPPTHPAPTGVPTVAVFGTGKRTGKTAIAGELARRAVRLGLRPVVVAMGRGGPAEPTVAEAGSVTLDMLVSMVQSGHHAASDYLEDALTTGVTTVGARRAGGGLAGAPFVSNVVQAVAVAASQDPDVLILEGSGAAIPPVRADGGILVIPASCPPEYLMGYLGPYRLLRTDLAVVTMASSPAVGPENLPVLTSHLHSALGADAYVVTDFEPFPLADVRGREAFLITTAPGPVATAQAEHLQTAHGCRVVGWSARLADRAGLAEDLEAAEDYDVLLTELKAAAVDTGVERAHARGAEVVFLDNRARVVAGSIDLDTALGQILQLATERGRDR